MREIVLTLREVTKRFPAPGGAVEALRGISLELAAGEFVAITGPSGSGKSTLLHVAALLEPPTSGEAWLDGENVAHLSERELARRRGEKIGMIFQKFCLLPHRSVLDNVLFRFRYLGGTRRPSRAGRLRFIQRVRPTADGFAPEQLARAALETVGLRDRMEHTARLLSGGEMQRVAIARAIALPPRLLAADEPTGNLDRTAAEGVMECLHVLNRRGVTILLVTHNEALLRHCSRHLRLEDGRIVS
ncbi:MAG: ABC transporter ATP-binding protein [Verrucomicrobia bacterium]|nr:MAG: ABC transporter ATP-binding protein [Verrucomicrobiota bacterium]